MNNGTDCREYKMATKGIEGSRMAMEDERERGVGGHALAQSTIQSEGQDSKQQEGRLHTVPHRLTDYETHQLADSFSLRWEAYDTLLD